MSKRGGIFYADEAGENIKKGDRMIIGKDRKIYIDTNDSRRRHGVSELEWFGNFVASRNYKKGKNIPENC